MNLLLFLALTFLSLFAIYTLICIARNSHICGSRSSDSLAHKIEHVSVLILAAASSGIEAGIKLIQIIDNADGCKVSFGVPLDIGYMFLIAASAIFTWHVWKEETIGNPFYYNHDLRKVIK